MVVTEWLKVSGGATEAAVCHEGREVPLMSALPVIDKNSGSPHTCDSSQRSTPDH